MGDARRGATRTGEALCSTDGTGEEVAAAPRPPRIFVRNRLCSYEQLQAREIYVCVLFSIINFSQGEVVFFSA